MNNHCFSAAVSRRTPNFSTNHITKFKSIAPNIIAFITGVPSPPLIIITRLTEVSASFAPADAVGRAV